MFHMPHCHIVSMATHKTESICQNQEIFVWQHIDKLLRKFKKNKRIVGRKK